MTFHLFGEGGAGLGGVRDKGDGGEGIAAIPAKCIYTGC